MITLLEASGTVLIGTLNWPALTGMVVTGALFIGTLNGPALTGKVVTGAVTSGAVTTGLEGISATLALGCSIGT